MLTKIAIVGSREFDSYPTFEMVMDRLTDLFGPFVVVSGGADGPDEWGETYARCRPHSFPEPLIFEASWRENGVYNPQAGKNRNTTIVVNADCVVAFWDGKSGGTKDTITKAKRRGKPVLTVYPDGRMELD